MTTSRVLLFIEDWYRFIQVGVEYYSSGKKKKAWAYNIQCL